MARYGIAVDTQLCVGCNNCAMVCKVENNVPDNQWWNRAMTMGGENEYTPGGTYPDNLRMRFITMACQHCDNPACVKVCPVGATYKDTETGVVRQDYDRCIGCRMCMAACPYTGVRSFNWDLRYSLDFAVGDREAPAHQKHTVEKCTMCWHRLARGERPACIDICRAGARYWGDLDDPESEIAEVLVSRKYFQMLPEKGTKPNLYYLM
ncbi:MAG: 4Fe-4S dicluster domain-containing protein [Eggerthellaceae bacterium]|nr:4Fe-4S dicluster domain-containing protein [Eggerthellaceae bacterium]